MTGCQLDSDSAFPTITCRAAQIHRCVQKKKILLKKKKEKSAVMWTYGEHIGGRLLITQVSSEGKRIQHDLDVVEAVLFPFKGVSVVCYA